MYTLFLPQFLLNPRSFECLWRWTRINSWTLWNLESCLCRGLEGTTRYQVPVSWKPREKSTMRSQVSWRSSSLCRSPGEKESLGEEEGESVNCGIVFLFIFTHANGDGPSKKHRGEEEEEDEEVTFLSIFGKLTLVLLHWSVKFTWLVLQGDKIKRAIMRIKMPAVRIAQGELIKKLLKRDKYWIRKNKRAGRKGKSKKKNVSNFEGKFEFCWRIMLSWLPGHKFLNYKFSWKLSYFSIKIWSKKQYKNVSFIQTFRTSNK